MLHFINFASALNFIIYIFHFLKSINQVAHFEYDIELILMASMSVDFLCNTLTCIHLSKVTLIIRQ